MNAEHIVLVTGLSGAGKSVALNALEDLGFYSIDNLPCAFVLGTENFGHMHGFQKIALAMDTRDTDFLKLAPKVIQTLKKQTKHFDLVFLEADPYRLLRRYRVTRRRHPLKTKGSITQAIRQEIKQFGPLRGSADHIIDTSKLSPHDLTHILVDYFSKSQAPPHLEVTFLSFGFFHGLPEEADLVLDVRFLTNPNFDAKLKRFNGTHTSVRKFVLAPQESKTFLIKSVDLLKFLIPQYHQEGKHYLTIAIGCTGGQHRSVVIAETLADRLHSAKTTVRVIHRDLGMKE